MSLERYRADFPVLDQEIEGKPIIYLDNACMTLKPQPVIDAMNEYYTKYSACGGRSIHKFATKVTVAVEESRKRIKEYVNSRNSNEIIFTRNATEGINLVGNSIGLKSGDVVLTTDREHNSNLAPWHLLKNKIGIEHKVVESNDDGTFSMNNLKNALDKNVKLLSMVHTSNLDGYTIPAEDVIKVAHEQDILVMLDGAQSAPHHAIDVQKLDVDFFAFSIHKMCGPTGVGVLYGKYDLLDGLSPFIVGGDTVEKTTYETSLFLKPPSKFEGGLQNYAGLIGSGEAAKYLMDIGLDKIEQHELELNEYVTEQLNEIPEVTIIGPPDPKLRGGITGFTVKDMNPHDIAMILDEVANIMIRSGMHCVHSWFNAKGIEGSVRVAFYLYNTRSEVDIFIEKLREIISTFS
ncbi:MAG: aminotransferase class V-fold PLP-dependent enzyme [Thermoplasmata archaeon]|nr:MAG: aminotransferase class V-fold PLP-dependent enzyme [Thermoplasmata archaeon]